MSFNKKLAVRSRFVALEALSFGLKPLHTSLISLLIIRLIDIQFWGEFVFYLVAVQVCITFLNWGQKPYLLKKFSAQPNKIGEYWSKAFFARTPLLIVVFCCLAIVPNLQTFFLPLLLWVSFRWGTVMFDSLIQFNRNYKASIKAEVLSLIVSVILAFFWVEKIDLEGLIYIFAFSNGIKLSVLLPILPKNAIAFSSLRNIKPELLISFPFFALTLAGMFQTKGDLYLATFLMDEAELGKYQVLVGFLLLGQAFSGILIGPFLKNVFRFNKKDVTGLKKGYLKVGLSISLLFTIVLYFLMRYVYLIDLKIEVALLIFACLAPLYFFLIESQLLLKHKKEKQLLKFTLIAASVTFALSFLLIPLWGIQGALISGVGGKVTLALLVVKQSNKIEKSL